MAHHHWHCHLAGCDHHWVTVDNHRVRVCRRCAHVTRVIADQQWPVPVLDVEIGQTTEIDGDWTP